MKLCLLKAALLTLTFLPVVALAPSAAAEAAAPDLILFDGKIFTSDPASAGAEALAIRGDRIVALGNRAQVLALADAHTRRVDLQGRLVIPGINDAHYHHMPDPRGIPISLDTQEPTWPQILEAVGAAAKTAPKGEWIFATSGIAVANDPNASRVTLDRVAPANPVIIRSYFGHVFFLNTSAMTALGVSEREPDPVGGRFERFPDGRIDGRCIEYAVALVARRLADKASDADRERSLRDLAREALGFGITSIQDMSTLRADEYVRMLRAVQVPLRMRVIRWPPTDTRGRDLAEGRSLPLHPPGLPLVTVSGTKWMLDGTPLERGAAVRSSYRDRPGWNGTLNFPESEVRAMIGESLRNGDPLLFHVSADRTAEVVLRALETEGPSVDWPSRRVRIEHGDGLQPDLLPAARRLGVVVVQNPSHLMQPDITSARFGTDSAYFPLASLLRAGIPLALGSDGPLNPYLNIMFSILDPVRPSEALTREQAVVAYTRGSAFAEFTEKEKGTLAPGMLADVAVLSQDIFVVPPNELPKTRSLLTVVGGKVVFAATPFKDGP
jgi:predicted amidohydrolase YtcJ